MQWAAASTTHHLVGFDGTRTEISRRGEKKKNHHCSIDASQRSRAILPRSAVVFDVGFEVQMHIS